ncbi:MAG TPA: TerC family protein [Fimbriimonadaceae bacterium]|nr:TerC family protein [Fimbriimonadaceae bacterium]HRJ95864.1 TerC family protein [Fimbriimonadaceae bacterium]
MMELLSNPQAWIGFGTLLLLEIVLGIDNIVFISILANKLPQEDRKRARTMGLALALITRIIFLMMIGWIASLKHPLFSLLGHSFSGRDLVLLLGGAFLIAKATMEIHHKLEGVEGETRSAKAIPSMAAVIAQILVIDLVFSIDSVITAVGMVDWVEVMIAAVIGSMAFMLWFVGPVSDFVEKHPSVKMLALSFLILIGANLVAEGLGQHIPKGYTYFAMAFSLAVECLNLRMRARSRPEPVQLRETPTLPGES